MIDSLLAKKLKDAGFIQVPFISTGGNDGEIFGGFYIIGKKDADAAYRYLETEEWLEYCQRGSEFFIVKVPTLSELIEACGLGVYLCVEESGSRARKLGLQTQEGARCPVVAETDWHSTPEEAVANLWLALQI